MSVNDPNRAMTIALAGQPNVGKSTIFNMLTGLSQHVGNWPGKTVERKEGVFTYGGREIRILDLPGAYGLTASSEEERIARNFIIKEQPDVVIMVANAAAIEHNLYLLAELLALPAPVALGLNMIDVAADEGVHIKPATLEAALGVPVTPIVAVRNEGVAELVEAAIRLADDPRSFQPVRHLIGLHGKSFLPFCLGFGCNVPAIMGARVIESASGRLLTLLLAPLVPCSARFAVLAFLAPVFFGQNAVWVSWGLVMLNIAVLAVVGAILNHTLFRGERVAFIMELPLYHRPNLRSIGLFMWNHTWSFLRRASTMILAVATTVWMLGYFPTGDIEQSWRSSDA